MGRRGFLRFLRSPPGDKDFERRPRPKSQFAFPVDVVLGCGVLCRRGVLGRGSRTVAPVQLFAQSLVRFAAVAL